MEQMGFRANRDADAGCIDLVVKDDVAAIVEVRATTALAARLAANSIVQEAIGLHAGDVATAPAITRRIELLRGSLGESVSCMRARKLECPGSMLGSYLHHDGQVGVIVEATLIGSDDLLRSIGMHIAAADPRPLGVSVDTIPADIIEQEKTLAIERLTEIGKPRNIAERQIEDRLPRFLESVALLEQPFVLNPNQRVKDAMPEGATIRSFLHWRVGG